MRTRSFVLAVMLSGASVAGAQTSSDQPIVQVGVFGYEPDGGNTSAAYDTEPSLASIVYVAGTPCSVGAGLREPPAHATDAWRFAAKMVSKTADEVVIQLTWQRIIEHQQPAAGMENTTQLTLRAGERIALDTAAPAGSCAATTVVFEARYMPRRFGAVHQLRTGRSGGGVDYRTTWKATGAGGGRPGALGRGRATGADAGVTDPPGGGKGAAASSGSVEGARGAGWMDVNLWLVHSVPGRQDATVHLPVLAPPQGADFAFPPMSIATPSGPAVVQIIGSFAVTGGDQLVFTTMRRVRFINDATRDARPDSQGTGRIVNRMPGSEEVLSFEMPPIRAENGQRLPDKFAVRIKIGPG